MGTFELLDTLCGTIGWSLLGDLSSAMCMDMCVATECVNDL